MRAPDTEFESSGRAWFRNALGVTELNALDPVCMLGAAPGARIPPTLDIVSALAPVDCLAKALLPGAKPVRVVAFNKSEQHNWTLPWHQDRVIALRERAETPHFINWTRKSNVWHAEPPVDLLERMLFLRIHLDPADGDNGCLEIAVRSHSGGRIADDRAEGIASAAITEQCIAKRGDVLAAKALILHRSGASRRAVSRRAIRVDYSADDLPAPLQWEFQS